MREARTTSVLTQALVGKGSCKVNFRARAIRTQAACFRKSSATNHQSSYSSLRSNKNLEAHGSPTEYVPSESLPVLRWLTAENTLFPNIPVSVWNPTHTF